jgi:hypothetical protein
MNPRFGQKKFRTKKIRTNFRTIFSYKFVRV